VENIDVEALSRNVEIEVVLKAWKPVKQSSEFRCFVANKELIGLNSVRCGELTLQNRYLATLQRSVS
jgi:hypothetical protein